MMRRSDNYLPVPGEEKNLDVAFISTKPRSNESIVRYYTFVRGCLTLFKGPQLH